MLKVSVLGSGNLGTHMVNLLNDSSEVKLVQWYSRSKIDDQEIEVTNDITMLKNAEIYILCVSDDSISDLSNQLIFNNKLVVHTSGSTTYESINKKNRRGVFYPLQSFSKTRKLNYSEIPVCIEAENDIDLNILIDLCNKIGCSFHKINFEQRKNLHLAAVITNNFTNYLFSLSKEILSDQNLNFDILKPLINETVNKIHKLDPSESQTGPARRNDQNIIDMHIKMLKDQDHQNLYKLISQMIKRNYDN